MKHLRTSARIGAGLVALTVCVGAGPVAAQEVRYYASGWPIALAEAACGGDEGCLTHLANCPPGTDGTCTAQVATCTTTTQGRQAVQSLCTLRLEGRTVHLRLPDGPRAEWTAVKRTTRRALRNPAGAASATCLPETADQQICFTAILDAETFESWANGKRSAP